MLYYVIHYAVCPFRMELLLMVVAMRCLATVIKLVYL